MNQLLEDYRQIFRIRNFEKTILDLFSQNKLTGTTHTCIGEEANPVALMDYLQEQDNVFGSHRCHGYFIAYAKTPKPLLATLY
jgi:TPP-dependent pyruvate/acetoin dehydrogenase alpha subunit